MRLFFALAALAIATAPAQAGGPAKAVVELFTSQGCSSCPPADVALAHALDAGGIVALSWHVDYWDYLGWRDTFSSAAATARQERYAARIGGGTYTPEFVVNGLHGSSNSGIISGTGLPVAVTVSGGTAHVAAGAGAGTVYLVSFTPSATVPIAKGENAGRSVTYRNVVTGIRNLGEWTGEALTLPAATGPCAVIVQRPGQGEIIGAAQC